jgi:hypothetical protein
MLRVLHLKHSFQLKVQLKFMLAGAMVLMLVGAGAGNLILSSRPSLKQATKVEVRSLKYLQQTEIYAANPRINQVELNKLAKQLEGVVIKTLPAGEASSTADVVILVAPNEAAAAATAAGTLNLP